MNFNILARLVTPARRRRAGLLLLLLASSGCARPARDTDAVTFRNAIGDDQRRESIEIRVGNQPPVTLEVRQLPLRKQRSVTLRVPDGIHSFTIRGEMVTREGKKVPIRGGGAIVRWDWLARRVHRDAESMGTARAWEAIHRELSATSGNELAAVALSGISPVTAEELAEAEARLGITMPAAYRDDALRFGSWAIGQGNEPVASLSHPRDLLSVWDWVERHHRTELKGTTPEWQKRFESTRHDLVAGTAGGAVVFHGRPDARCKDGSPSFELPAIEHEDFLYEDSDASEPYFSPQPANCDNFARWHAWHSLTSAIGEITGPSVVVVTDETTIRRDTDASTEQEAILFPESPWPLPWVEPGN